MDVALSIIGPGRLGRSLARLFADAGWSCRLVGRGDPLPNAGWVLLTVPDAAIGGVAAALPMGPLVLHTSGAADLTPLRPHRPAGSFHPLMTFPGPHALPDLTGVPVALAGDAEAVAAGEALAAALGLRAVHVPGDRRLYHAAAVMAGNFATVLLADAASILRAAGVPAEDALGMLAPLAVQSIRNAASDPARALTGPVARRDVATIDGHRAALADLPELLAVYERLLARAEHLRDHDGSPVPRPVPPGADTTR